MTFQEQIMIHWSIKCDTHILSYFSLHCVLGTLPFPLILHAMTILITQLASIQSMTQLALSNQEYLRHG